MNTEHELFGELHEQEENGLFGNEHRQFQAMITQYCQCDFPLIRTGENDYCGICGLDIEESKLKRAPSGKIEGAPFNNNP